MDSSMTFTTIGHKSTWAELLPELTDLLNEDKLASTTKKNRRKGNAIRTTEKFKPLSMVELNAAIEAVNSRSAKKLVPPVSTSTVKKRWNSSVKVEKKVKHVAEAQMKDNPVRRVLYVKPTQATTSNTRATMINPETPKFPKPGFRPKKSLHNIEAKESVRISGIYNIPQTPIGTKTQSKFNPANKENIEKNQNNKKPSSLIQVNRKIMPSFLPRKLIAPCPIPDTPLSNDSWKSSSDASFLQKEKEIQDTNMKEKSLKEPTLENIAEISPPASTPFKEYRSVQEYFNNSSDMDNTVNDDTIMCFDRPSISNDAQSKREESVIVSLCDMFNKASVTNHSLTKSELDILLDLKNEFVKNIQRQLQILENLEKLIQKKREGSTLSSYDKTLVNTLPQFVKPEPNKSPIIRCSVIKSPKSPSYKVPKRGHCLRRKVFHKLAPDMHQAIDAPKANIESQSKAMNMYMEIKEHMIFLNTPVAKKQQYRAIPDTPAVTSENLQQQLNKLFDSS